MLLLLNPHFPAILRACTQGWTYYTVSQDRAHWHKLGPWGWHACVFIGKVQHPLQRWSMHFDNSRACKIPCCITNFLPGQWRQLVQYVAMQQFTTSLSCCHLHGNRAKAVVPIHVYFATLSHAHVGTHLWLSDPWNETWTGIVNWQAVLRAVLFARYFWLLFDSNPLLLYHISWKIGRNKIWRDQQFVNLPNLPIIIGVGLWVGFSHFWLFTCHSSARHMWLLTWWCLLFQERAPSMPCTLLSSGETIYPGNKGESKRQNFVIITSGHIQRNAWYAILLRFWVSVSTCKNSESKSHPPSFLSVGL